MSGLIVIGLVVAVLALAYQLSETREKLREAEQDRDDAELAWAEAERQRDAFAIVLTAVRAGETGSNGQQEAS